MQRQVVLVDENDQEIGTAEIYQAHQGNGLKHRALSLFLWRPTSSTTSTLRSSELRNGTALGVKKCFEVLLQKRAMGKPVFRGLWGNTCCTNLRPGDEYLSRAASRVREEMGVEIDGSKLENLYRFSYEAEDYARRGWGENELDTVVVGEYDGPVKINKEEATDYLWVEWEELKRKIKENPRDYAPWLIRIMEDGRVEKKLYEGRKDRGRQTRVKVPGKVIISGEHSAVYGKLALAASLDRGVRVKVERNEKGEWREFKDDQKFLIKKAIELAGGDEKTLVTIESELPIGSGLGSSAAVSAAVIKGVREYLGKPIADDELFELTMDCERIAHGNPSGIDPATVIYRGLIAYVKGQPIKRLQIVKPRKILVINSGIPTELSREMIVDVVGKNKDKTKYCDAIELITEEIREKLLEGGEIVELINQNGLLLEQLGVVGERARQLSKKLRKMGYGVKISGAGGVKTGSGMMIMMGDDFAKAKSLLDNQQIEYFETVIGGK